MINCEYCGTSFLMPNRIVNKRFCSPLCRRRDRSDRDNLHGKSGATQARSCGYCDATIPSTARRGRIYCSKKCKVSAYTKPNQFASEAEAVHNLVRSMRSVMSNELGYRQIHRGGQVILLDLRIVPCFAPYTLFITERGYACINYDSRVIPIHRIVYLLLRGRLSSASSPLDHINQNKLDNRIENLRLVNVSKNNANRNLKPNKSGYRGVYPNKDKWIAQISIDGRPKALGRYTTREEAALAYNRAAIELWGSDAMLNTVSS